MAERHIHEQQKEILIKALVGIAALFLCYVGIIQPTFLTVTEYRQDIQDAQKKTELFREIQKLDQSLSVMEDSLATLQGRPMILGKIQELAGRNGVDIQTLTPKTTTENDYVKWTIEVDAKGTFFSFVHFLQGLEKMKPIINCKDVSVLRRIYGDKDRASKNLQIHLVLETYLKTWKKKKNG